MLTSRKKSLTTVQYLRRSFGIFARISLGFLSNVFAQGCAVLGKDGPVTAGDIASPHAPRAVSSLNFTLTCSVNATGI
jgi:hypothetical protein